ncbi:MAG: hypothetical protein RLZZ471_1204 [Actinomycetota bacterium]
MSSLYVAFLICVGVSFATWLFSVITKEYSWVDRIWSIAPIAYLCTLGSTASGQSLQSPTFGSSPLALTSSPRE